jgi:hypothetical protein
LGRYKKRISKLEKWFMTEDEEKEVLDNMTFASMVSLARDNIRPDIQKILLDGSLQNGARSNAILQALSASLRALREAQKGISNGK